MELETKRCSRCGKEKMLETGFYVDNKSKDGHSFYCKECRKQMEYLHYHSTKKKCPRCGRVKRISDFYKKTNSKDGHQPWCKECTIEYNNSKILDKVLNREIYKQCKQNKLNKQKELNKKNEQNKTFKKTEIIPITTEMILWNTRNVYCKCSICGKLFKSENNVFECDECSKLSKFKKFIKVIKRFL